MSKYFKCNPGFWTGKMARAMRKYDTNVILTASYLSNNQHANMLGIYHLPISYISIDTGMSYEQACMSIEKLSLLGFCRYDPVEQYVWVVDMVRIQVGYDLKPRDHKVKHFHDIYNSLPQLSFLDQFYTMYQKFLYLQKPNYLSEVTHFSKQSLNQRNSLN